MMFRPSRGESFRTSPVSDFGLSPDDLLVTSIEHHQHRIPPQSLDDSANPCDWPVVRLHQNAQAYPPLPHPAALGRLGVCRVEISERDTGRWLSTRGLDVAPTEQQITVVSPSLPDVAPVEHVRYHDVPHVLIGPVDRVRHRRA